MNKKLLILIAWLLLAALCCSACSQSSPAASDASATTPFPSATEPTSSPDSSVTDTTPAETTAPLPQTLEEIEAWVDEYHVQNENRLTRTHTIPCGDYVFIISDRYMFTNWPAERIPMEGIRQIERYCISTGEMLDFGWMEMSHCSFSYGGDAYSVNSGSYADDGSCRLVGLVLNDEWMLFHHADGSYDIYTKPHYMVVEELPAVAEHQQLDEPPAPTVIIGQQITFDGISILADLRYAEHRGIGMGVPCAYNLTSFNAETREMTIELPLTVPGNSLEVPGSNLYIESARIEARGEDGCAIILKLSEYARYCLRQSSYIDSPTRYDEGTLAYEATTWTFDCTDDLTDDAKYWTSPNDYPGDIILF